MKCAYEQGREEAIASFEKQRSRMQRKVDDMVSGILETYKLGVCLEMFRDDPTFESHVLDTKAQLQALSRSSTKVTRASPFNIWLENTREDTEMQDDDSDVSM